MLATSPDGLIPISMAMLSPEVIPGLDIYLKSDSKSAPILFCTAEQLPDFSRLAPLIDVGVNKLFIDRCDRQKYQEYLRENWQDLLSDESQPITQRMAVVSEVMRDVLSDEFAAGEVGQIVDASKRLAAGSCELIADRSIPVRELCKVLHHDYATFTHSANVSLYGALLARAVGLPEDEVEQVLVGGLLHDIGKLQIDERILTKPGKLDDFEFREIKKHPITGFEQLVDRDDLSYGQLMMTYQHHERLDGSGYPVGLTAGDIHVFARLAAIVDVYEALTSQRPYRRPMSSKTALAVLEKGNGTEFDSEMLRCWRELVQSKQ